MFTGLVAEVGEVAAFRRGGGNARLRVRADLAAELSPGDSVAVDGACLTVVVTASDWFEVDVSAETTARTTLGNLRAGEKVNLELPLTPTSRIGGHFVQGHVDGIAYIRGFEPAAGDRDLELDIPAALERYIALKGSLAVAGVSLTVARLVGNQVTAVVIPHTYTHTALRYQRVGNPVNVEVDVIAKYVERLGQAGGGLTISRLAELGYGA